MLEASLPLVAAWTNAALLGIAGLVNWFDGRNVRDFYLRWSIPPRAYRTLGLIEITAASFLIVPHLRAWGIVLAAMILLVLAVVLVHRRHYAYALAVSILFATLGAAALAIPTYDAIQFAVG